MKAYIYKYLLDERKNIILFVLVLSASLISKQYGFFIYFWLFTFQTPSTYIDRLGFSRKDIFQSGLVTSLIRFVILTILTFLLYGLLSMHFIPQNFRVDVYGLINTLELNGLACFAYYVISNHRLSTHKNKYYKYAMATLYITLVIVGSFMLSPFINSMITYPVERLILSYIGMAVLFIIAACLHYINLKEYAYVEN